MDPTSRKPEPDRVAPPGSSSKTPAARGAATQPATPDATHLLHDTQLISSSEADTARAIPDRLAATELAGGEPAAPAQATPAPPSARSNPPDARGEVFGDFRLDKKLGEGGMGAVYKAQQISMDRTIALKLLSKNLGGNPAFVERFYREARTMAKLDHPNIVRGIAVGDVGGQHYVAMEFIDGLSMQKWMDKLGKLSVGDALHVALCAAHALEHAHEQNLVHRDIKPDNILVTTKGVVKVADLGLAKKTDDDMSLTQSGTGFGTPFYMPIEQYRDAKHVDGRADIYALGVSLYYFLTGKYPFFGETHFEVLKAKETGKFVPVRKLNIDVPERLELVIDKMIQRAPAHRYRTCTEVIEALESLGLASDFPSFLGAAPAKAGAAAARRPSTLPAAAKPPAQRTSDEPQREMWVLRYSDNRGQRLKKQVSTGRLKQLLEQGEIDPARATVHRVNEQNQRAIGSVPEFASLVQSKMVQAKADRRSQKLDTAYAKLEKEQRRRELFRKIGGALRGVTSFVILIAILAGLAIGGWWLWNNRQSVSQKVQQTVQEVSGTPKTSPTPAQPSP